MRFSLILTIVLLASTPRIVASDPLERVGGTREAGPGPIPVLVAAQAVARPLASPSVRRKKARPAPARPARMPARNLSSRGASGTPLRPRPAPPANASAPNPPPTRGVAPVPPVPPSPPPLTLSASRVVVPLGENRSVTLIGSPVAPTITVSPAEAVTVAVAAASGANAWALTVQGLIDGEAAVRVAAGTRELTLLVQVMKWAGQAATTLVEVTGQPAPAEFVRRAARAAVAEAVRLETGAALTVGSPLAAPPELPAGQEAEVVFPVSLAGPGLLPVKSKATVTVRNRDLDRRDVGVLLYSNEPERVAQPGSLFAAELTPNHPARLLYHHQNAGQEILRIHLQVVNPTDQPADVQVIEGAAGPTFDPVEAGHRAASRYLRSTLLEIGSIVRVPAQSQRSIAIQRVTPDNTVSGIFGLRSLDTRLFLRVAAEADSEPAVDVRPAQTPDSLSDHVYHAPRKPLRARYVVGQHWAFLKLGGDPLVGREAKKKLFGNYGVSYEMSIDLSNPTDQPQTVAMVLSPDAGHARGVFLIDGAIVEIPPVAPPTEADLATFRLQPGERRAVRVETIPVGGSSYPARVVVRPAGPISMGQAREAVPLLPESR